MNNCIEPSDAELLRRAEKGEKDAMDLIVDRWFSTVLAVVYGILADVEVSREVAQETFLDAMGRLGELREINKFGPWLCSIARHKATYALRRRILERAVLRVRRELDAATVPETPPQAAVRNERIADVRRAVGDLPTHYREVVVLRYLDGRSHEEIAKLLGISPAAVDKRLQRAKELLRGTLRRDTISE
jgi:RNA polymerase sigma-70 factor (ECF subfamily)